MRRLLIILGSAAAICAVVYVRWRRRRDAHGDAGKVGLEPSLIQSETREPPSGTGTKFPSCQPEIQVPARIGSTEESETPSTTDKAHYQAHPCETEPQDVGPDGMRSVHEPDENILESQSVNGSELTVSPQSSDQNAESSPEESTPVTIEVDIAGRAWQKELRDRIEPINRGGQPRTSSIEREKRPESQRGTGPRKPELVCWKRDRQWVLAVQVPEEFASDPDLTLFQGGRPLMRDEFREDCWHLTGATGQVSISARQERCYEPTVALAERDCLLFKLGGHDEDQGRRVKYGSCGSLCNERIVTRHIAAVALSFYFRAFVGRFAKAETLFIDLGAPRAVADFKAFLVSNRPTIEGTIRGVLPKEMATQLVLSDGSWIERIAGKESRFALAEEEVSSDYKNVMDLEERARNKRDYRTAEWAQRRADTIAKEEVLSLLSRKAVIPKYGFPVDVVELDTQRTQQSQEAFEVSLQRDLSIAISEFAPTSKLVANKKEWTSYRSQESCSKGMAQEVLHAMLDTQCISSVGGRN
jgi:hypothetical protein